MMLVRFLGWGAPSARNVFTPRTDHLQIIPTVQYLDISSPIYLLSISHDLAHATGWELYYRYVVESRLPGWICSMQILHNLP